MQEKQNKATKEIREYKQQESAEKLKVVPLYELGQEARKKQNAKEEFKLRDTYLYHERNIRYKIISNRLKIIAGRQQEYPNMRIFKHQ